MHFCHALIWNYSKNSACIWRIKSIVMDNVFGGLQRRVYSQAIHYNQSMMVKIWWLISSSNNLIYKLIRYMNNLQTLNNVFTIYLSDFHLPRESSNIWKWRSANQIIHLSTIILHRSTTLGVINCKNCQLPSHSKHSL